MNDCFVSIYACVLHACLVLLDSGGGCWIPWNWNYRWLWATMLGPGTKPRSLQEHQVHLTTESSLQPPTHPLIFWDSLSLTLQLTILARRLTGESLDPCSHLHAQLLHRCWDPKSVSVLRQQALYPLFLQLGTPLTATLVFLIHDSRYHNSWLLPNVTSYCKQSSKSYLLNSCMAS